jgi:hypothetical protein
MNRKDLIEKAAKEILWSARGDSEPDIDWPSEPRDAERIVQVALAVFEEANVRDPGKADIPPVEMADNTHIPTDDEQREALIALRLATHSKMMSDGYLSIVVRSNEEAADLVLDAGFHRTSTGWMFSPEECPNREHPFPEQCGLCGFHRTVQGEPSNVSKQGVSDISPAQMSAKGEPSDAQVIAAMNAYDPRFPGEDLDDFQENEIADMRAALRAAAEQGGQQ